MRTKLLLIAGALIAFGGCVAAPFLFDDFSLFTDPVISSPNGWWESWRITQTRPLTWFTFWINHQLGGENPIGYHLVNLALHLGVVLLVWDLLRRLIPERAALVAAAMFAVHPILTEPIAYVFARGTLLATVFSLLAIRSWIGDRVWPATAWFAVGMLAKEECAAVPVLLVLLDLSRGRRIRWTPVIAMAGIAFALGLRVIWLLAITPGAWAGTRAGISPLAYLATQGVVILRYLRMTMLPWGFSIDPEIIVPPVWLALLCWTGIALLAALALRRFRGYGAGFWFLGALVLLAPSSSIFPASDLAADRRMYLPMVALCACAGLLLSPQRRGRTSLQSSKLARAFVVGDLLRSKVDWRITVVLATIVLAAISFHYTALWRSPEAVWTEAVRLGPGKLRPRLQLARSVDPARALRVLEEAQVLAPQDPAVAAEQGRVLLNLGKPAEALAAFGRALALDPSDPKAMNNRGTALAALGQTEAARQDYQRALEQSPCLQDARLNLQRLGVPTAVPPQCH